MTKAGCSAPGSTGCQPVVAGSLPATLRATTTRLVKSSLQEVFGRLLKTTGWQPVLPGNSCFVNFDILSSFYPSSFVIRLIHQKRISP
jgi:hypothetical protein